MTQQISRRSVAAGAAWGIPAIVATAAAPALAASTTPLQYYTAKSVSGNYSHTSCTLTNFNLTTTVPVGAEVAGFSIGYPTGAGADTTATLSSLSSYVAIPKGMVTDLALQPNSNWTMTGPTGETSIPGRGGATIDTTNYDVYKLTFSGPMTNPVVDETQTTTWPGSTYTLTGATGTECSGSETVYAGYYGDYSTANGYGGPFNNVEALNINAA